MKPRFAALLLTLGCATTGQRISLEVPVAAMLTVNNERGEDVAVYIVQAGIRGRRLGQVTSYGTATFALTASDAPPAADVQFLAKAVVSGTLDLSDPIPAASGASYEWKLAPARGYQFLALRFFR
jgi:hypothetical protein